MPASQRPLSTLAAFGRGLARSAAVPSLLVLAALLQLLLVRGAVFVPLGPILDDLGRSAESSGLEPPVPLELLLENLVAHAHELQGAARGVPRLVGLLLVLGVLLEAAILEAIRRGRRLGLEELFGAAGRRGLAFLRASVAGIAVAGIGVVGVRGIQSIARKVLHLREVPNELLSYRISLYGVLAILLVLLIAKTFTDALKARVLVESCPPFLARVFPGTWLESSAGVARLSFRTARLLVRHPFRTLGVTILNLTLFAASLVLVRVAIGLPSAPFIAVVATLQALLFTWLRFSFLAGQLVLAESMLATPATVAARTAVATAMPAATAVPAAAAVAAPPAAPPATPAVAQPGAAEEPASPSVETIVAAAEREAAAAPPPPAEAAAVATVPSTEADGLFSVQPEPVPDAVESLPGLAEGADAAGAARVVDAESLARELFEEPTVGEPPAPERTDLPAAPPLVPATTPGPSFTMEEEVDSGRFEPPPAGLETQAAREPGAEIAEPPAAPAAPVREAPVTTAQERPTAVAPPADADEVGATTVILSKAQLEAGVAKGLPDAKAPEPPSATPEISIEEPAPSLEIEVHRRLEDSQEQVSSSDIFGDVLHEVGGQTMAEAAEAARPKKPAPPVTPPPPAPPAQPTRAGDAAPPAEPKLTVKDIFGDILEEIGGQLPEDARDDKDKKKP